MRKLFFLILLLTAWAIIFWPMYSDDLGRLEAIFSNARPSEKPLPPAWQNTERLQVQSLDSSSSAGFPVTSSPGAGYCGDTYTVQNGDTLGEIAKRCGISLVDLLAANRGISNPNHVYSGQQIVLPDPQGGRGGADPAVAGVQIIANVQDTAAPGRYRPGSVVKIEAGGLPPNASVRIGLGLASTGYTVVAQSQTGADGRISTTITLPADARPGDTAFIMVSTRGVPSIQRMSEAFQIVD